MSSSSDKLLMAGFGTRAPRESKNASSLMARSARRLAVSKSSSNNSSTFNLGRDDKSFSTDSRLEVFRKYIEQ